MNHHKVIIIGAGLTGISLAYFLEQHGFAPTIIEARDRVGGRISTLYQEGRAPVEMGATWLGKKHTHLTQLLETLGLPIYPQVLGQIAVYEPVPTAPHQLVSLPPNDEPSYRIKGGTFTLIKKLLDHLESTVFHLNEVAKTITLTETSIDLTTQKNKYQADLIISTLPPNLLVNTVQFGPQLPQQVIDLSKATHTWMGESIKVGLHFKAPFWQKTNLSGTIFSNIGPINEMYDHSDSHGEKFALKGFVNSDYHEVSKMERQDIVIQQLRKYYGDLMDDLSDYVEMVWRNEPYTYFPYSGDVLPHQHNGHPAFRNGYLNQKLMMAGSETAIHFPGYMEGAISSAQSTLDRVLKLFKDSSL